MTLRSKRRGVEVKGKRNEPRRMSQRLSPARLHRINLVDRPRVEERVVRVEPLKGLVERSFLNEPAHVDLEQGDSKIRSGSHM
jgi:hypothetical protein